jgi:uncharacterized protein (DUF58 family)
MLSREEAQLLSGLALGGGAATTPALSAALRRARMQGSGLEFHDYRHYQPGDDPRSIDWTVEARLQQLVVRVARADGHLTVHALVDTSASMGIGVPDKLSCASRIAAALCYVALEHRDAAGVATFDTDLRVLLPPATGRGQLHRALTTLSAQRASGGSAIGLALMRYGAVARGPGLAVVISDFLTLDPGFTGLEYLLYRGLSPAVVQVLAPDDTDPAFDDAELVDVEDTSAGTVIVDRSTIAAYKGRLAAHQEALHAFCAERHIPVARVSSSASYDVVVGELERVGLVSAGV